MAAPDEPVRFTGRRVSFTGLRLGFGRAAILGSFAALTAAAGGRTFGAAVVCVVGEAACVTVFSEELRFINANVTPTPNAAAHRINPMTSGCRSRAMRGMYKNQWYARAGSPAA